MSISLPKEWGFLEFPCVIEKGNLVQGFLNSCCMVFVSDP